MEDWEIRSERTYSRKGSHDGSKLVGAIAQQCFIIELRLSHKSKVMSLSLTPEVEQAIAEKIQSGRYQSAEEVIMEGLRLIEERDHVSDEQRFEELRQKIAVGTEQIAKGQVTDGEMVFDRLQSKIQHEYQTQE
jgi:antitoxin ParD1/3/4